MAVADWHGAPLIPAHRIFVRITLKKSVSSVEVIFLFGNDQLRWLIAISVIYFGFAFIARRAPKIFDITFDIIVIHCARIYRDGPSIL